MSIRTAKEIACDFCPTSQRIDAPTLTAEWPALRKDGWHRERGKHVCPKCSAVRDYLKNAHKP